MKCPNCGFEIEKPNQKTCPLCGHKITPKDIAPDEGTTPQDATTESILQDEIVSNVMQPEPSTVQQEPEVVMLECPICGIKVSEDTNFCPRCGHNMHEETMVEQPEISPEQVPVQDPKTIDVVYEEKEKTILITPDVSEELPPVSPRIDNYRAEDTEEYIDNGAYIPDQEEETDELQDEEEKPSDNRKNSSVWHILIYILIAVASLAAGAALYYVLALFENN